MIPLLQPISQIIIWLNHDESLKFQNPELLIWILKLAVCLQNFNNFKFKWSIILRHTENKSKKLLLSA